MKFPVRFRPHSAFLFAFAMAFAMGWAATVLAQANPLNDVPLVDSQVYLRSMLENEQTRNDKVENTKEFESILDVTLDPAYRPDTRAQFKLNRYLVPSSLVVQIDTGGVQLPEALTAKEGKVPFFVHPISEKAFSKYIQPSWLDGGVVASPLSSYRSLLAWEVGSQPEPVVVFNLKVSLDTVIGDSLRMLSREQIERASVVSMALNQADRGELKKQGILFIDEPYSVYLKGFEYGFTFRETPALPRGTTIVPIFSLYAKKGRKQSMLEEILERQEMPPQKFISEKLLRPLIEHMFYLGFNEGLVGEPHEQNVLAELRRGKLTGRFFYRDLGGFNINLGLRARAGKAVNIVPPSFKEGSMRYDRALLVNNLEAYLLDSNFYALANALSKDWGIGRRWIQNEAKRIVYEQVEKWTGAQVRSMSAAKGAVTKYSRGALRCNPIYRLM